jgi:hypothetical protein
MSNDITIKLTVSDQLLAKLAYMIQPPQEASMEAIAQLLGATAHSQPPAAPPKERAKVGFKTK